MWKSVAVVILALMAINWHLRYQSKTEIPKFIDEYWGPGEPVPDSKEIKPFKIVVSKETIDDLHQRLDNSKSLVAPLEGAAWNYGISTTYLKTVLKYWREKYNWNERQILLNKYPQFTTKVQGLNLHFYHVKPQLPKDRNVRVLPLMMVHGWPGSVVEFLKIIPLLTTPRSDADYVFELVIPSLPGYGFSTGASKPGLGHIQMSVVLKNLMLKLGFERFYTQGGDWGSIITSNLALLYPENVAGLHLNFCYSEMMSPKYIFWSLIGVCFPSLVVDKEHHSKMYPLSHHIGRLLGETGYMHIQSTKPDTLGVGLTDSPVGLAAYILEKFSTWTNPNYIKRNDGGLLEKFTLDELLDNVMIYWITNSITTSVRLYSESFNKKTKSLGLEKMPIVVPTSCAMFPHEIMYHPEVILKERFTNIIQFTHLPRGGHFAAYEEPDLLATDIWSFVRKREQIIADKERLKKQSSTKA